MSSSLMRLDQVRRLSVSDLDNFGTVLDLTDPDPRIRVLFNLINLV